VDDQVPDLCCALSFFIQLIDKESLLETELSASAVVGCKTIEQTPMPIPCVAIAIAWLLREKFRVLLGVTVSLDNYGIAEMSRIQDLW
jgi:hypothetical protein